MEGARSPSESPPSRNLQPGARAGKGKSWAGGRGPTAAHRSPSQATQRERRRIAKPDASPAGRRASLSRPSSPPRALLRSALSLSSLPQAVGCCCLCGWASLEARARHGGVERALALLGEGAALLHEEQGEGREEQGEGPLTAAPPEAAGGSGAAGGSPLSEAAPLSPLPAAGHLFQCRGALLHRAGRLEAARAAYRSAVRHGCGAPAFVGWVRGGGGGGVREAASQSPKVCGSTSVGAARGGGGGARRGGGPLLARRGPRAGARAAAQRARRFCRAARRHRRGAQHLPRRLPAGRVRAGAQLRRPGPISLLCAAARLGPVRAAGGLRAARGGAL